MAHLRGGTWGKRGCVLSTRGRVDSGCCSWVGVVQWHPPSPPPPFPSESGKARAGGVILLVEQGGLEVRARGVRFLHGNAAVALPFHFCVLFQTEYIPFRMHPLSYLWRAGLFSVNEQGCCEQVQKLLSRV